MSQAVLIETQQVRGLRKTILRSDKTRSESLGRHYALANSTPSTYVTDPLKPRPQFRPDLIDAELFLIDPIRPYPQWPLICLHAHLPAFETLKDLMNWNDRNGHFPILATWTCGFCWMFHHWSTTPTDSNGAFAAGAGEIPQRIKELMQ